MLLKESAENDRMSIDLVNCKGLFDQLGSAEELVG